MCVWRLPTAVLQCNKCNSQNRRVMTNTSTHVHRWPGVTGESLVPIHWNPSIPRSSPKHYLVPGAYEDTATRVYT